MTNDSTADRLAADLVAQVVDYAIIALDADGVIRTWNAGARRVKGYTDTEAIGRHFSIFYTDDDRAAGLPERLLERAEIDGRVEHTGWRVRNDGTRFWGDVIITALHDERGALTGYAKVTRDLTEQHRLEEARTSLFATVSHDLRSPVMSIGAYASLIATADAQERVEFAERIVDNAVRLEQLVNGLFDHAKLSGDGLQILLEPLSLSELIGTALVDNQHRLAGRTVDVDSSVDGVTVVADRPAMLRVLDNVLGNAVKYSPGGSGIEIRLEQRPDTVVVGIVDHGRGIDAEDLPAIFDEFVRGRFATQDGGTGLGLASVRALMTRQRGQVWIDSEVGLGTTVSLELPRPLGDGA